MTTSWLRVNGFESVVINGGIHMAFTTEEFQRYFQIILWHLALKHVHELILVDTFLSVTTTDHLEHEVMLVVAKGVWWGSVDCKTIHTTLWKCNSCQKRELKNSPLEPIMEFARPESVLLPKMLAFSLFNLCLILSLAWSTSSWWASTSVIWVTGRILMMTIYFLPWLLLIDPTTRQYIFSLMSELPWFLSSWKSWMLTCH